VSTTGSELLDRFALPDGFDTLLVDDDQLFPQEEMLCGYILGRRTICIGTEGLRAAPAAELVDLRGSLDGRFAAVLDDGDAWVARTDFACQEQLFLYQSGDGWIIGSSLFEVAMRAAARDMQLTREPRHARSLQRGMLRRMPTGLITQFAEIARLPIGADVRIDKRTRSIIPRQRTVEEGLSRYADLSVHEIADEFVRSSVGALASMQRSSGLVCDLTGGYDSRLVFALAMQASSRTGIELGTFSNRNRPGDWDIARSITEEFGLPEPNSSFKYPDGSTRVALHPETALGVWLHSAFDGKVGLELPSNSVMPNGAFSFQATGHVAITARFNSAHAGYASTVREAERLAAAPGLLADHHRMLGVLGVEPDARLAMPYVFMQCYSPNHSGSHWKWRLGGTTRFTPLTHSAYIALYVAAERAGLDMRALQARLLAAVKPRLLAWPHAKAGETWPDALHTAAPIRLTSELSFVIPRILGRDSAATIDGAQTARSPSEMLDLLVHQVPELRLLGPQWMRFRESTSTLHEARPAPEQISALQDAAELGLETRKVFVDALLTAGPPAHDASVH
jgi:hypothetical protein